MPTMLSKIWILMISTVINGIQLNSHGKDSPCTHLDVTHVDVDVDPIPSASGSNSSAYNFMGQEVLVSYVTFASQLPTSLLSPDGKATIRMLGSTADYQIFAYVQDALNLTALFHPSKTWARQTANKSWEGMADLLVRGQVDYAADSSYLLRNRVQSFRFLTIGYKTKLSAYFQIPQRSSDGFNDVVFTAFSTIWPSFIVLLACLVFVLVFAFQIDLSSACLLVLGNFSQQGITSTSASASKTEEEQHLWSRNSIKIFFYVICLCFYVINAHIAASFISKFAVRYKTISNLQDLLDEGYKFGVLDDSFLINSNSDDVQNQTNLVLDKIMLNPSLETVQTGVEKLLSNNKFALLTETDILESFNNFTLNSQTTFCDVLREIVVEEKPIKTHGFVRKGSNISDPINFAMTKMWSTGNAQRFLAMFERSRADAKPNCLSIIDESIHLAQLKSPCFIIGMGLCLSCLNCLLENFVVRRKMAASKWILQ